MGAQWCQEPLSDRWPLAEPSRYLEWMNQSQGKEEIENIRYTIRKGRPYGSEEWVAKAVAQFGLEKPHAESRASEEWFLTLFLAPLRKVRSLTEEKTADGNGHLRFNSGLTRIEHRL